MSWVAASGWDTKETCEAGTSTIVACARSAMNRWSSGGIALSSVPSRYQHGSVFHAGGAIGTAANAAAAYGRCVVAITMDISDQELAALNDKGARGVRLNTDNKGGMPIGFDQIGELEARIKPFGWHFEWLFPGKDILELMPVFKKIKVPMSIGHFAYQPATAGVKAPGFQALLGLMRDGNTWMKISGANRVSETDLPPYDDVKPMAHALIEAAPDRIMWGTDWPHPNKYLANPNDGDLVDAFGDWVSDQAMRQKIMVDTPARFYRF